MQSAHGHEGRGYESHTQANNQDGSDDENQSSDDSTAIMRNCPVLEEKDKSEGREVPGRLGSIKSGSTTARMSRMAILHPASIVSFRDRCSKLMDEELVASKTKQGKEFSEQGKVKVERLWRVRKGEQSFRRGHLCYHAHRRSNR
jgi:hypothetical protein